MKRLIPAVCILVIAAGLSGCSTRKYAISGTVTRGGEKLTWPNGGMLLVIYIPENRERDTNLYSAETDIATSTYKIAGIPPGKYTVAVQQFDPKFMDALGGVYDPGHTDIVQEVTQDGQVIDIDLPKERPNRKSAAGNGGGENGGGGRRGRGAQKADDTSEKE
ncbi:MAG TPA: hypothetical protein VKE74_05945 [Gemmataceae bacterium]|nr:hypothetical protein [Gemmataceae bacterium]